MTPPRNPDHPRHDPHLVAAGAAGDLTDTSERAAYEALVRECADCTALASDLTHLRAAVHSLPPRPIPAGRDFRLDASQAARLRRRGWLRGILGTIAGARIDLRPVGGALAALGVAGLILTAGFPPLGGGASLAARDTTLESTAAGNGTIAGGTPAPAPASSHAPASSLSPDFAGQDAGGAGSGKGSATGGPGGIAAPSSQTTPAYGPTAPAPPAPAPTAPAAPSLPLLPLASLVVLAAGVALWVLGLAARRLG